MAKTLTIEQARAEARLFHRELEGLLKCHPPSDYAPNVAAKLKQVLRNADKQELWPPHSLLHSIESNCAYARGHRDRSLDTNRLARIINLYHGYKDPYLAVR